MLIELKDLARPDSLTFNLSWNNRELAVDERNMGQKRFFDALKSCYLGMGGVTFDQVNICHDHLNNRTQVIVRTDGRFSAESIQKWLNEAAAACVARVR